MCDHYLGAGTGVNPHGLVGKLTQGYGGGGIVQKDAKIVFFKI